MPKISLSGPADLLTILPFHLGFQPTRSVVVVCFHGKRLGLVARFDLVPARARRCLGGGRPAHPRARASVRCLPRRASRTRRGSPIRSPRPCAPGSSARASTSATGSSCATGAGSRPAATAAHRVGGRCRSWPTCRRSRTTSRSATPCSATATRSSPSCDPPRDDDPLHADTRGGRRHLAGALHRLGRDRPAQGPRRPPESAARRRRRWTGRWTGRWTRTATSAGDGDGHGWHGPSG